MKNQNKKSCCGCFGVLFKDKKTKPKMIEMFAQTDSPMMITTKVVPETNIKAQSDTNFYPRVHTPENISRPKFRTMIITRHNVSSTFYNDSIESAQTPIVHNYKQDESEVQNDNPVPMVFENSRNRITSRGLPLLVPVTPARFYRGRSNYLRQANNSSN
ncbi:hypothetical protein SteCoe_3557 [Stentor coeruleus]|uniref:Uncharacterized protein n=1 Tax=Stentor coeruleus TaxID=5963 RepID=A0A1R2CWU8_9CILI|nr:hypothetical protein SteCoe_3557 [Stentor coeruleus]